MNNRINSNILMCALLIFLLLFFNLSCSKNNKEDINLAKRDLTHLIGEFDKKNIDTLLMYKIDSLFDQIMLSEQSVDFYNLRAGYLVSTSRIPEARQWYIKTLKLDPYNTGAHTMLGILADHDGEQQTAQQHYQRALITIDSLLVDKQLSQESFLLFQHKASLLMLSQGSKAALVFWDEHESIDQQLSDAIAFEKVMINDLGKEGYILQLLGK